MVLNINNHVVEVTEQPTDIRGLKFRPQMRYHDNDADWSIFTKPCPREVSPADHSVVEEAIKDHMTHAIVEIGVGGIHRPLEGSFTELLLAKKPDEIPYLGIDCEDKTYLRNEAKKVFTVTAFSNEQQKIRECMKSIGIEEISILFIDGFHSVNAVINDWQYTDMLADGGIVIFHDTNYHPGPKVFIHAIDEQLYRIERCCQEVDDYGVAIAYKL